MKFRIPILLTAVALSMAVCVSSAPARAHCDTLDGPVVVDAKAALQKGDVTPVLKWVKKADEAELKEAFKKTLAVRGGGSEAKELADRYFFETLIRIHRAGEGAPYTGLKPAGSVEPSVAAADKAIESGSVAALAKEVGEASEKAILERFEKVMAAKKHKDESVEAGREFVEAYVIYVHFVEGLHAMVAEGASHGGHSGEKAGEAHGHE
ncbi:MAG TPA: DUF6448 family protein [Geobacteraceae bacterium]